uniref:Sm domain-containing protein n=1 Tax=Anopheles arabiensis TaxID=7173 RepID=A0A182HKK3_ANOAR
MNLRGKEKYNSVNHLTGLAQCLIDRNTIIDLRNETMVAGTIVDVDGYMNVTMENAVYIDQLGRQYPLDNFMVYSKYIRYIHIPKDPLCSTSLIKTNTPSAASELRMIVVGKGFVATAQYTLPVFGWLQ